MPGGEINTADDQVLYTVGEAGNPPTLYLPVDKNVEFKLHSPDVIHDFGVPGFLEKQDVIPGPVADDNHFQVHPTVEGDYRGKCYELCGVYHSRMLFNVKIVSDAEFQQYLHQLQSQGNVANQPLLGGITSQTQAGVESGSEGGSE
jgi:cytochrome c oxidase subunit 2